MTLRTVISAILLLMGMFIFLTSVIGLLRFKNVLDRIHAAALGDTMGIFLTVLGLIVISNSFYQAVKLALVVVFIWLTSPVTTHLIGKIELLTAGKNYTNRRNIK